VSANGSPDPATVRPLLGEAAAEGLEGIRKSLLDAARGAVRDDWIAFECGECGARKRVEVPVADVRARVAAIELLLRGGLRLGSGLGEKWGGKREGGKLFVRASVCAEAAEARLSSPTPILLSSPGGPPLWCRRSREREEPHECTYRAPASADSRRAQALSLRKLRLWRQLAYGA
jgi:hypothetical protein